MDFEKDLKEFWPTLQNLLYSSFPQATSNFYFSKTYPVEYDYASSTLTVICTNSYVYSFFCGEQAKIEQTLHDAFRVAINVNFLEQPEAIDPSVYKKRIIEDEKKKAAENESLKERANEILMKDHPEYFRAQRSPAQVSTNEYEAEAPAPAVPDAVKESSSDNGDFIEFTKNGKRIRLGSTLPAFNPNYTFDKFIEGESNKFAKAACYAVATKPASGYNPLFIHGASGLGKTHLLYAIITKLKEDFPDKKIMFIPCEQFANQMIQCIAANAMPEFREMFRTRDILLIDDIQFIEGKPSTQEEIFHTINAMIDKCQIIFTSDRPPSEMKNLEDRLRTRFEWGLLADIQPPDLELRVALFKSKAEENNIKINDDVILFLAENLRSNVRQIEGAIKRFSARAFLIGRDGEIDMEYARSCLPDLLGTDEPIEVTVDKIFSAVYDKYSVSKDSLIGPSRVKNIAYARKVAIHRIKQKCGLSVNSLASMFGRDHSTVTTLLNDFNAKKDIDEKIMSDLNDLYGKLGIK